jgi:RsiW-degrading membrane proteinase PrsW (M82 family)
MRDSVAVGTILLIGLIISLIARNYAGIAIAALGIPAYLSYRAREQNILAKSRLYDRDLFVMIIIAIAVILAFDYFWDPRMGLITLAVVIPLLAMYADRLQLRKKLQEA